MLDQREWDILSCIAKDRIEDLDPPLKEEEMDFYKIHKAQYDRTVKDLPPGKTFMFVPANE